MKSILGRSKRGRFFLLAIFGSLLLFFCGLWYRHTLDTNVRVSGEIVGAPHDGQKGPKNWHIELAIPPEHVDQVRASLDKAAGHGGVDVEILLRCEPTMVYHGKLVKLGAFATVRIHSIGEDIPQKFCVPEGLLLSGSEVSCRIPCGL